jgi:hypothetical protein
VSLEGCWNVRGGCCCDGRARHAAW